jgi:hypothetical protein
VRAGHVTDDVLVGQDLVGHAREGLVAQIDLALAAGGDLVVMELARDSELLEREHHRRPQVGQGVVRSGWEVPLLLADGVAEPRLARVPVTLGRVDGVVRGVDPRIERDLVEDEELALGAEIGRVGDPGAEEMLLGAPRDTARA